MRTLTVVLAILLAGCSSGPDPSKLATDWQHEVYLNLNSSQGIDGARCIKDTDAHHFTCSATVTQVGSPSRLLVVEMVVADDGSWVTSSK